MPTSVPDSSTLARKLRAGERASLARAITLIESKRPDHQQAAHRLVQELLPETGKAAQCPICLRDARRVFTPPGLTRLARPVRQALETEEASAHEPQVVTEKRGRPLPQRRSPTPPWVLH